MDRYSVNAGFDLPCLDDWFDRPLYVSAFRTRIGTRTYNVFYSVVERASWSAVSEPSLEAVVFRSDRNHFLFVDVMGEDMAHSVYEAIRYFVC